MTRRAEPDATTWQRWLSGDHPVLAALRHELETDHRPEAVHVGHAAVVATQTRLRLSDVEWVKSAPGRGPEDLDTWVRDNPQVRLTTFWINGSVVDGYIVADPVEALVIAVIDKNRSMVPVDQ